MTEMDDRSAPAAADGRQVPAAGGHLEVTAVLAGAVVVLLLLVPAAFVVGWRMGRTVGRLRGY